MDGVSSSRSCLQGGRWEPASAEEQAAPAASCPSWTHAAKRCAKARQLFNFRPAQHCDGPVWNPMALNRSTFSRALNGRTLRFIGDSLTLDHYQYLTRCVLGCKFEDMRTGTIDISLAKQSKAAFDRDLTSAGYSADARFWAHLILRQAAGKDGWARGCKLEGGGLIDFRRFNSLPANTTRPGGGSYREILAATLHALMRWPAPSLRRDDVVVLNLGLHEGPDLYEKMMDVLNWWRGEGERAPYLLWRQGSPQHWQASSSGRFHNLSDVARGRPCHARPMDEQSNRLEDAFAAYDFNVSKLVLEASDRVGGGRSVRRRWTSVLDVFTATWSRDDDHPRLVEGSLPVRHLAKTFGLDETHSLPDCTHYCIPGSVFRFWSQALLVALHSHSLHRAAPQTPAHNQRLSASA